MPEITFMMIISNWNFVCVPKFQLEILKRNTVSTIHNFLEDILESSQNVSETPPWITWLSFCSQHLQMDCLPINTFELRQKFHWSLFLPMGSIFKESPLAQVMAWCQVNTWTNDDYMLRHHTASLGHHYLTHWGQMMHTCVRKLTIIGSDNGLSPGLRQAIIWTNARIFLIGHLVTNFKEISSRIHSFSFKKIHLKMSSGKRCPFCLSLNVLTVQYIYNCILPNLCFLM